MSSKNITYDLARRRFVADQSDLYALKDPENKNSGVAQDFAQRLAATPLDKSGLRGLESLAWSTDSVGDIVDYIRVRVGRDNRGTWSNGEVGLQLAEILEEGLQREVNLFFKDQATATEKRLLHLDLCREFIKHLVAYFEFEKSGVKYE
jgi:hypothetical protein